jgi:hypothetical protein
MSRYVGARRIPQVPDPSHVPSLGHIQADQDASSLHDLASRTVSHLKARDSADERVASGTIRFDRDEVSGPLRSAPGTDGVVDIDDTYEEEIKEQEGAWTHKVKREHAQHTKVRSSTFRFLVPFQPALLPCSLAFLEGFLSTSGRSLQMSGSSGFPQSLSVRLVIDFCDPQINCTRIIRSHSLRLQPIHDTVFHHCTLVARLRNVKGRVLRPLYFSI